MNEPPMRRGLSPEGRRIRERHQSSLLNDEFGVTSQPIHKKIEKDFLKENIMRLKEIQAKCRTQESRPISGNQPVKAIRPSRLKNPPSFDQLKDEIRSPEEEFLNLKLREGSAHSDYFSLTDDPLNDSTHSNTQYQSSCEPMISQCFKESEHSHNERGTPRGTHEQSAPEDTMEKSPCFSPESNYLRHPFNPVPRNASLENGKPFSQSEAHPSPKGSNPLTKFGDFYPHALRRSKIGNVMEKIKSKKPACDTNTHIIWRDIGKQHKPFLTDEFCSAVSTPRTPKLMPKKCPIRGGDHKDPSGPEKKQSNLARTQSLDRGSRIKTNLEAIPLNNSTYTLSARPTSSSSSSTCLLNLDQNSRLEPLSISREATSEKLEYNSMPAQGGQSLPNLTQQSPQSRSGYNNAFINQDSSRQFLCPSPSPSVFSSTKEGSCLEDLKNNGIANDITVNSQACSALNGSSAESDGTKLTIPIITKRDASIQTSSRHSNQPKQRSSLLRSNSSSNLYLRGEPPPTYKRGQLPRYLKSRKADTMRRLEAAAAVDPLCPPGHTPLPDHERMNTLELLKKGQTDMLQQLSGLPVSHDTLRVRKLKQELEAKLSQIEEGIEIFSQPKVYVLNDE